MGITVTLPEDLALELDRKVAAGEFTSREDAVVHYLRKGMRDSSGGGGGGGPRRRDPPGGPPGTPDPTDRPIQVDPTDVNWA